MPVAAYDQYKDELLTRFIDSYGLAVELHDGSPDGIGDSGWRTGLATICAAIERDANNTERLLRALDGNWRDGRPVRHPEWTNEENLFSRDQFYPQMAACYYAWRFCDDSIGQLAKGLLARFIDVLRTHNWRFNTGEAAYLPRTARFILALVAASMGLRHDWRSSGWLFSFYVRLNARRIRLGGADPSAFYGIHNLFWQILLAYELRNSLAFLKRNTRRVYEACVRHNTAPYFWITRHEELPRQWLEHWPPKWNGVDYVWQRSEKQQLEDPNLHKAYPRLDYMVLFRLFDLTVPR